MKDYNNASALDKLTLGKTTTYSSLYDASLLQAVPRSLNRDGLNINAKALPFVGEDVWYGYEVSWLNSKGKPVVAIAEFRFPCTNSHIVESKSFKLYLNSLNQTKFESKDEVINCMVKDLSKTAQGKASVKLFSIEDCPTLDIAKTSHNCIDDIDIEVDSYQLDDEILKESTTSDEVNEKLVSHILKSNCLITNQPDWASLYIEYSGSKISHEALLRYIISFREHNEFHEQCVERIFCDITKYCQPNELTIYARYTRRGGLDINPFRSTQQNKAPNCRNYRQ